MEQILNNTWFQLLKEEMSSTLNPTIGLWIGQPKQLANIEPVRNVGSKIPHSILEKASAFL